MPRELEENKGWREFLKLEKGARAIEGLALFFALGGAKDAKRIREQLPAGKLFIEDRFGVSIRLARYPTEGHRLTRKNFRDFWNMVGETLAAERGGVRK